MTDIEINIAIAEACGWIDIYYVNNVCCGLPPHGYFKLGDMMCHPNIPDYINDLNAMHEAEKVLISLNLYQDYWPILEHITGSSRLAHATARQKAEAFLRTINKWVA